MSHEVTKPIKGDRFEEEPISELEIVQDGCFRDLIFRARVENDVKLQKCRTLIRRVSITKMDELARAWGKMHLEACVYIDQPIERVTELTHESFALVVQEGRRLNFTLLSKWQKWNAETAEVFAGSAKFDEILKRIAGESMAKIVAPE